MSLGPLSLDGGIALLLAMDGRLNLSRANQRTSIGFIYGIAYFDTGSLVSRTTCGI